MIHMTKAAVLRSSVMAALAALSASAATAQGVEVTVVIGATGNAVSTFDALVAPWEERTGNDAVLVPMPSSTTDQFGQYRLWLAAGNPDIDLYQTDVIWAPQLADHFVDLTQAATEAGLIEQNFPSIIESQTVDGKLVALPVFTDAPALYYRTDLLEKYGASVPTTWEELQTTAQMIQDKEREAGNTELWGFVFQGNAYEGLTCDALEWIKSNGGGQIIEPDGTISVNNEQAAAALDMAAGWVGTISPEGVLAYMEEESRGVWQTGNAVFMRNWPYAYALSQGEDSAVAGKFDVAPLPAGTGEGARSAATLGGWNMAVSRYGDNQDAAIDLALYLASAEAQKFRAVNLGNLPTIQSLYQDPEVLAANPYFEAWQDVFQNAVPRPSAPAQQDYNEVSTLFFTAVHSVLSGEEDSATALDDLEADLEDLMED
ncbi:Maltose/maltodextrin ABC transporter, substrate binding protein periplasmic protein MalE [Rubellimicrobium mesophilum DSM 19309]|uniref:Maltose/maltodextrin ABC transporter, substrate binding protein periplasmic protein MalE n=1 Tax=Rubellimicrobium mesophilum DSM 19309 TaxID=442562 RepID=A0A017HI03_9RHOB|nr:ABC transporter substrate-binding protein [Rubellimicrobium mesophilum]EYD74102.1 Maltose/maltodextrin ABC transporter, substrate binding protein periplasmic protein MalE [Rubellimicrobium mesophilum DSM 19309]